MDLFFAYMFVASATPLFLWLEHRKIAVLSIPFIVVMWLLSIAFLFEALCSILPNQLLLLRSLLMWLLLTLRRLFFMLLHIFKQKQNEQKKQLNNKKRIPKLECVFCLNVTRHNNKVRT